jgi:predicted O-methyltransferase YrrM
MRYLQSSVGSAYLPKLLGIYERELNPFIKQACVLNCPLIVDIGAAEGYYAVGMALRNPNARIVAFEMEERGRRAMEEMAKINGVAARIEIRGKCDSENLKTVLADAQCPLIICDAEGSEETLLQPDAIPAMRRAHLLVEMHEFISAGITDRITKRFATTHNVRRIWQEDRHRSDLPFTTLGTKLLPRSYLDWAVSEWRPERMSWLWMEPRVKAS